jgi:hypothetical protein
VKACRAVDFAGGGLREIADPGDAFADDADIGAGFAAGGDDGAAAQDQVKNLGHGAYYRASAKKSHAKAVSHSPGFRAQRKLAG